MGGGYARHASGLIVPEELKRERTVRTREEFRIIDKATALLQSLGIETFFRCAQPECQNTPMERIRSLDGGITYRCNHRDLVFVKLPNH